MYILGERVNLKVNSFNSEAGSFDLTGSGLESISCLGKSFSKSGQDLVADLNDCVSLASARRTVTATPQQRALARLRVATSNLLWEVSRDTGTCPLTTSRL